MEVCWKQLESMWGCWLSLDEYVKTSTLQWFLPVALRHSLMKMWFICIHTHIHKCTHMERGMFS